MIRSCKTKMIVRVLLICFISGLTQISCVPVYRANTVFVPAFTQKDEFVAEASLGSGEMSIHSGYAITDQFAIIAGYQNRRVNERVTSPSFFTEMGVAWFTKPHENISSEILSGCGYGQYNYFNRYNPFWSGKYQHRTINTRYMRSYMQYNLHFHVRPVTFSLLSRVSYVQFNGFKDYIYREHDEKIISSIDQNRLGRLYMEPLGAISVNVNQISFFAQSGVLLQVGGRMEYILDDPFILNFGVRFRINQKNTQSHSNN